MAMRVELKREMETKMEMEAAVSAAEMRQQPGETTGVGSPGPGATSSEAR
jgi:hypothetical protein